MKKPYLSAICMACLALQLPGICVAQKVDPADLSSAQSLQTKFKDDRYAALSSSVEYTFDKDKNKAGQPIVTAAEQETVQFIALNDVTSFKYFHEYNGFVELKKFRLSAKEGRHYSQLRDKPTDQASTDDNIFLDDSRLQYFDISLNKKGQMAQTESETKYVDSKYLTKVFFHDQFPIHEKTVRFVVPKWLHLEFREVNFAGYTVRKTQEASGRDSIYTFTLTDLESLKNEYAGIGIAYTSPHLIVMVRSFEYDGSLQNGFQGPADLYKWYNYLYQQCKNEPEPLRPLVADLTRNKKTDIDKVKAIYYWVQDNIRYIAFENGYAGFIPDPAQHVLAKKYGDCKGMANLLTEMLKLAGLDAHFTWIGTKSIPYDHANTPALCVDNHCICTLYLNGQTYFLDGTEKYVPFGENAYRIQGKSALIQKGDQFEIRHVPISEATANKLSTSARFGLNGNILKGHIQITLTGNERTDFHQAYQDLPIDKRQEYLRSLLEFGNNNLTVTGVKTSDLKDRELPVVIDGDIELDNNVTEAGKDAFVTLDFFPKTLGRFMPDNKRQRGYDFESRLTYEDTISLAIPTAMKFIDLPATVKSSYPGYSFNGSYNVRDNTITLTKLLTIREGQIQRTDFPNWTAFLRKMKEFNSNQVSITKK